MPLLTAAALCSLSLLWTPRPPRHPSGLPPRLAPGRCESLLALFIQACCHLDDGRMASYICCGQDMTSALLKRMPFAAATPCAQAAHTFPAAVTSARCVSRVPSQTTATRCRTAQLRRTAVLLARFPISSQQPTTPQPALHPSRMAARARCPTLLPLRQTWHRECTRMAAMGRGSAYVVAMRQWDRG